MAGKAETFKRKGEGILKKPTSMESFLGEAPEVDVPKLDLGINGASNAQMCKTSKPGELQGEATERFHLQIRKDLADKVFDEVLTRKRRRDGKKATQRAVFEEALERFLG